MNDKARTAIIAFINSLFPVLQLLDVINLDPEQIAALMLAVNNGLTLVFFFVKSGQEGDVVPVTPVANVPSENNQPQGGRNG